MLRLKDAIIAEETRNGTRLVHVRQAFNHLLRAGGGIEEGEEEGGINEIEQDMYLSAITNIMTKLFKLKEAGAGAPAGAQAGVDQYSSIYSSLERINQMVTTKKNDLTTEKIDNELKPKCEQLHNALKADFEAVLIQEEELEEDQDTDNTEEQLKLSALARIYVSIIRNIEDIMHQLGYEYKKLT